MVSSILSKNEQKWFNLPYYDTWSRNVFVRFFLEELKTPKGHFEIKWPVLLGPLGYIDLPTAMLTEKFQETGGHLAVLDIGDSLAPTETQWKENNS